MGQAAWQDDCVSIWRELRLLGADAEGYAGEQGMRGFFAFWQARGHPIVATIERFITQCRFVGEKVEQSGRTASSSRNGRWRIVGLRLFRAERNILGDESAVHNRPGNGWKTHDMVLGSARGVIRKSRLRS